VPDVKAIDAPPAPYPPPVEAATPPRRAPAAVTMFDVVLRDGTLERVHDADAYQQEGPMTTFFRTAPDRQVVDSWSTRMASFRTADITVIRRRTSAPEIGSRAGDPGGLRSA
jgi:hypothetical protein